MVIILESKTFLCNNNVIYCYIVYAYEFQIQTTTKIFNEMIKKIFQKMYKTFLGWGVRGLSVVGGFLSGNIGDSEYTLEIRNGF